MDIIYLNLLKLQAQGHTVTVVVLVRTPEERQHLTEFATYCDRLIVVTPRNVDSYLFKAYYRILYSLLSLLWWWPRCTFYGSPPELRREVRQLTTEHCFDLVEIHHSTSAALRDEVSKGATALYLYDVHFRAKARLAETKTGLARLLALMEVSKFHRFETQAFRRFDLLMLGQEEDKVEVLKWVDAGVAVNLMPNVIDTDTVKPTRGDGLGERVAIFVGAMTHQANVDAVTNFFQAAWPQIVERVPGAEWWIVGASPPEEIRALDGQQGVRVFADVPDVRPYISKAAVYVAPLRIGSGVKVKIMEALALGKAIVASPVAAEGMGLTAGMELEVAELDDPFAATVVRLFSDATHRAMLEANAREAAVKLFSVTAGVKTLAAAYDRLPDIQPRRPTRAARPLYE
jgi:glycosyltransferase involved in cell wall biosynthesis